ncbi:helix-turn-helix domain-containing protein [Pseudolabrys taiwanensis]|uniref:Helix-turn-helix domain-containing protein n=1 Tax=Pseudolabrys taiwanensis TaxID=331696 RepID=A0A345ZRI9_9HYPH|nr:helix-turn-helix domain-containing protein [Pseudolabrys taiwanensis]AXK79536.1 helix-turn-helix domain-containing protein [Pseudolabrys taiwanensis]
MTPGEHLRLELKRLALNQGELAAALGVSRQTINNVINGRQPVSRALARKLGPITGKAGDYWLRDSYPEPPGAKAASKPVNEALRPAAKSSTG